MNNATHWTVPPDHPAFAGHFPGTPILPGVVLLDVALQIIADASGIALDLCEISSVKFLSPASPGDELLIQHSRLGQRHDPFRYRWRACAKSPAAASCRERLHDARSDRQPHRMGAYPGAQQHAHAARHDLDFTASGAARGARRTAPDRRLFPAVRTGQSPCFQRIISGVH